MNLWDLIGEGGGLIAETVANDVLSLARTVLRLHFAWHRRSWFCDS